jgi:undecaprenyl-diphosphatase
MCALAPYKTMEIWKAIIVGIVQGLAEFLPISSSGHIVLTQYLLGIREVGADHQPDLGFEVILHVGTLVSVLLFFRRSLWRLVQSLFDKEMIEERKKIMWLAVATLPAVIAALLFKDFFDAVPGKPVVVSALLFLTGLILFIPRLVKGGAEMVGLKTSVIMGIAQAFAILPGISRSGSTIAAGMVSGAKAEKAAEFSFLMSIPAITGGFVLTMKDRIEQTGSFSEALKSCFSAPYLAGAITSAVVGLLAIYLVMGAVKRGKLEYFSYYCFAAATAGVLYFSLVA